MAVGERPRGWEKRGGKLGGEGRVLALHAAVRIGLICHPAIDIAVMVPIEKLTTAKQLVEREDLLLEDLMAGRLTLAQHQALSVRVSARLEQVAAAGKTGG